LIESIVGDEEHVTWNGDDRIGSTRRAAATRKIVAGSLMQNYKDLNNSLLKSYLDEPWEREKALMEQWYDQLTELQWAWQMLDL
jgi:hypothetical protein